MSRRNKGWSAVPVVMVLAMGSWGCAHLPKTGTESTGEPLNVEVRTETHTYVTQAKVGEVQHRDSSGRLVGTSSLYENQVGSYDVTRWQVFQGEMNIDDQDFYSIAGDADAAAQIADYRSTGVTMNRVGIGLAIAGGAAMLAGIILGSSLSTKDEYGIASRPTWTTAAATGGILMGLVGGGVAWAGYARTKREHPIDDPQKAANAARRYNKQIGEQPEPEPEEVRPRRKRRR
ncbi:phage holin family protein [Polyangium fumosum]|nr:phage holin family protein [Polyangium fumosum]